MNHETQRLLVAASRGARVQTHYHDDRPTWRSTGVIYGHAEDCGIPQRIHPEDTHLQYGPISTELRKVAADVAPLPSFRNFAWNWFAEQLKPHEREGIGGMHFLWLCAFAAELAADEGL